MKQFFTKHKRKFQILWCIYLYLMTLGTGILTYFLLMDVLDSMGKAFDDNWEPKNADIARGIYLIIVFYISRLALKDAEEQLEKLTTK